MIRPSIHYFKERVNIPKFYQVHRGQKDYKKKGIKVRPVLTLCKELGLP